MSSGLFICFLSMCRMNVLLPTPRSHEKKIRSQGTRSKTISSSSFSSEMMYSMVFFCILLKHMICWYRIYNSILCKRSNKIQSSKRQVVSHGLRVSVSSPLRSLQYEGCIYISILLHLLLWNSTRVSHSSRLVSRQHRMIPISSLPIY